MDKASTRGLHKVRSALPSVSNNNSFSRRPFRAGISRSGRAGTRPPFVLERVSPSIVSPKAHRGLSKHACRLGPT
jgi:hypothetical protein